MAKAGPLKTDQDFFIIDAPFPSLLTRQDVSDGLEGGGKNGIWTVDELAVEIKKISGVLEVGIFWGCNGIEAQASGKLGGQKPVAVYFGMEDGSVKVRQARPAS